MEGMRIAVCGSRINGQLALCSLFAVSLALGALRSMGWSFTSTVDHTVPEWVVPTAYALLLVLCGLSIYMGRTPERSTYLLGASAAIGVFPQIPKLPFFQDLTHVALFLFLIAHWKNFLPWRSPLRMSDWRVNLYLVFFFCCVLSVIANFLQRGDVWQLKVGLSGLVLQGLIFMALYVVCKSKEQELANQILRGLFDAAQISFLLGAVTIVLLLIKPYSVGVNGEGQDTIWGLCYFDRLKLMFDGPGIASVYFVVVMNFGIFALSDRNEMANGLARGEWPRRGLYFLVLVSPWLIVASGSRIGRINLALSVLFGCLSRPVRRISLILLPFTVLALVLAADFQSFPNSIKYVSALISKYSNDVVAVPKYSNDVVAVPKYSNDVVAVPKYSNDIAAMENLRLQGRFFAAEQRGDLMVTALLAFKESSLLNKAIGMGYGVSGFRASTYPSPHNEWMKLVTEVGVLGFLSFLVFLVKSFSGIFTASMMVRCPYKWAIGVNLISILGLSFVYVIGSRGFVLAFLLVALCTLNCCNESKT